MMDLIESAGARTTTIMVGFTFMMAVRIVFINTFLKTSEDIMRSATAKIANSIIAIILSGKANIRNTPGHPQDRENGVLSQN
jgi:hypothetical protein